MMDDCEAEGGIATLYEARHHWQGVNQYGYREVNPGDVFVMCHHTGVVYGPPFHWMLLEDLLWPQDWGEIDWPGMPG